MRQALLAEQMLRHAGERQKAAAIASKRTYIETQMVRRLVSQIECCNAAVALLHCGLCARSWTAVRSCMAVGW